MDKASSIYNKSGSTAVASASAELGLGGQYVMSVFVWFWVCTPRICFSVGVCISLCIHLSGHHVR